jgi:hypothetical protein
VALCVLFISFQMEGASMFLVILCRGGLQSVPEQIILIVFPECEI